MRLEANVVWDYLRCTLEWRCWVRAPFAPTTSMKVAISAKGVHIMWNGARASSGAAF